VTDHAKVVWNDETQRWDAIAVTERVMRSWESHDLAVAYMESFGLTVIEEDR
jgi:hypothetical protein